MSTFIDIKTAAATATSLIIPRPDGIEEGDLLLATLVVFGGATNTLTLATGWTVLPAQFAVGPTLRVLRAYRWVTANEESSYTLTYTSSVQLVGAVMAYRGVTRDFDYDPVGHPYGYFAPAGNITVGAQTATTALLLGVDPGLTTFVVPGRCVHVYALSAAASFDDIAPLAPIRATVTGPACIVMFGDTDENISRTVRASAAGRWLTVGLVLETFAVDLTAIDNYKSKLLRQMLPSPPYDTRLSSNIGRFLAVIGTSDNEIGGLFGAADFLPDEEI